MKFRIVDAFTSRPFTGNPAAVCILETPADDLQMQNIALEINLSETAFLWPEGPSFRLRWFTPLVEVDLCGHATLAAAHVLWETGVWNRPTISFVTRSGELVVTRQGSLIEMSFPSLPAAPCDPPADIVRGIGAHIVAAAKSKFDYLIELESERDVRELAPDLGAIARVPARGVMVTARGSQYDFVSRFFGPAAGVPEDPVTGSAHCTLGPYWQEKLNKSNFRAFQASKRGGEIGVRVEKDRVYLSGQAVTTMTSELIA